MSNVYAPVRRAEEMVSVIQQCSAGYNLTPLEQTLMNRIVVRTIRRVAMKQVANNLLRPYTKKLNNMCQYKEHSFNMSINGTVQHVALGTQKPKTIKNIQ